MSERTVLRGRIVRLDPLDIADVDDLVVAAQEDRGSYGFTLVPTTRDEMSDYVTTALEDEKSGWALPFVIRLADTERVVGSTRFLDLAYWNPSVWAAGQLQVGGAPIPSAAEIGSTWLAASVQRTAVNTEAKFLMLSHAFETWGLARVTLKTDARNAKSRRAIERIGATFEGIRRVHMPAVDGSIRDTAYYSVLRAEWPAVRAILLGSLRRRGVAPFS